MKFKGAFAILLAMSMIISSLPLMIDMEVGGADGNFGGGSGTPENPFVIEDVFDLQAMNENLSAHYVLVNDIDASETETWNDGAGFDPVGKKYGDSWENDDGDDPFIGILDGKGHTISGLFIDRTEFEEEVENIGLFGHIGIDGIVKNLILKNVDIKGNLTVGSIVAYNEGSILNSSVNGSISGRGKTGGLVGDNDGGLLSNCHTDVAINGTYTNYFYYPLCENTGGIAGINNGILEDCSSSGNVDGGVNTGGISGENMESGIINRCQSNMRVFGFMYAAGLIGDNDGSVSRCHSTGEVRCDIQRAGGLIAINHVESPVMDCYATGDVYSPEHAGGLMGSNNAEVTRCFSTGNVNGKTSLGGLAAFNDGDFSLCYSTGKVTCIGGDKMDSGNFAGGLVTMNRGSIENCYSTSDVEAAEDYSAGLIVYNQEGIVRYCYSTGSVSSTENEFTAGLIVNNTEGSIEDCYWDTETSGHNTSDGGEGRTTTEMKTRATYSSWDFGSTWAIYDGVDYPYLQAFPPGARILSPRYVGTLVKGDSLRFKGTDIPGQKIGHKWTFSDGRTSEIISPGVLAFQSKGSHEVSYSFTGENIVSLESDSIEFDVVDDQQSYPDFTVMGYRIPEKMSIGEPVSLSYFVVNTGDADVSGSTWKDSIYLSEDMYLDALDTRLTSEILSMEVVKEGGYEGKFNVTLPAVKEGPYYLIVSVNDEWSFTETHRLNNEKERSIDVAIPELKEGVKYESDYSSGKNDHYFRINLPSSKNIHLKLEGPVGLEMMARHSELPLRSVYDHHSDDGDLTIQSAYSGTWYVLVHGDGITGSGTYSIQFDIVEMALEDVAPSVHVTGVPIDLIFSGVGFVEPIQVFFIGSDGTEYEVPLVDVNNPNFLTSHLKGDLLPEGIFDARVVRPGKGIAELESALQILEEGEAKFEAKIIPGPWTGYHEHSIIYVEYANTGTISMRAPLLYLTAVSGPDDRRGCMLTHDIEQWEYGIWTAGRKPGSFPETPASLIPEGFQNELLIIASGEVPGILQAGETRKIPIYYVGWEPPYPRFGSELEWQLYMITEDDDQLMDWDSGKDEMRPDGIKSGAWNVIWNNFKDRVGSTYGDFIRTLNDNALHLFQHGQRLEDVDEILSLTFQQAEGWIPGSSIYSRIDNDLGCPGLDLTFERYYPHIVSKRYDEGYLGQGWLHNWQYTLEEEDDGTVKITDITGEVRIFQPNIRSVDKYMSQPGDWGELKETTEGGFQLKEKFGNILTFDSSGNLDYIEDLNGNRITCEYTDGSLSKLLHSCGQYLEISYNSDDVIDKITDSYGRSSTYSYEGGYLTTIEYFDGYSESYNYDRTEGSPSKHALTGITPEGESRITITYNDRGSIRSCYRGDDLERSGFIYGRGLLKITDQLGNTERFLYDHQGRIIRHVDPQGNSYWIDYDSVGQVESITDPQGLSINYENYEGNLNEITGKAGEEYLIRYGQETGLMERIIDPTGSSITYDRDDDGNVLEIIYPDGNGPTGSYDEQGNMITLTNERKNTTNFSYDPDGRITSKTFEDGSGISYSYDDRGNLISMEDSNGKTNFTYNSGDLLSRMEYPGGQWLEFTYDNSRRRSAIIDQLGNRINYDYDHAGRLEGLTTSTGVDIVIYEYDQLGRTSKKTLENGVFTTYGYDAAGRVTKLANFKEDETVISWFNYTYDGSGRVTKINTHEGTWHYTYDDRDQLVNAVFDPIDPGLSVQDIEYNYDSMGNRIRTVTSGIEEYYSSNDLNQYTSAGNVTFGYDPDGNLISRTGPNGTTSYTYNDDNRLISVSRGNDTWEYSYDGLGNRVSITENGVTSNLVIDPIGIGKVVGVYSENGTMRSRFIYGTDLVGMETGEGDSYFYDFDLMGNTRELTDSTGSTVNTYSYLPFGDVISDQGSIHNPFKFVGEKGVMTDSTGLIHMRARIYDPEFGRFTSMDPIGVTSGDMNLYRYVFNSPTNLVDPEGLLAGAAASVTGGMIAKGLAHIGINYAPWGMAAEGVSGIALPQYHAEKIGAAVDVLTGLSTLASVGTIGTAMGTLAVAAPIIAPLAPIIVAGAIVIGVVSLVKGLFSLFDFAPANTMTPLDPNQKLCLNGTGPGNHVAEGTRLSYIIEFENMEEATAPAQIVTIIDPLSEDLDWSTFEFTEVGFGDFALPLNPGTKYIDEVMDFSYEDDDYDMEIELHIIGEIDTTKGEIFVMFYSIDPETELPPEVNIGFLPPEDGTGRGQGYFTYNIDPVQDLPSGTEIRNIATIQFNLGMEIDTNQIDPLDKSKGTSPDLEALVTIDAGSPDSSIDAMDVYSDEEFEVSWSGEDEEGGSGIAEYDIYVKENDGDWTIWIEDTNLTSAQFNGTLNNTYDFYSVATDLVGHEESKDPLSEASTTVREVAAPVANAGPDQTVEEGTNVTFDGTGSTDEIGIDTYTWTFNDGNGDIVLNGASPVHLFEVPGNFTITLNVTNAGGLWDSDSMLLTVTEKDDDPQPSDDDDDDDDGKDKNEGLSGTFCVLCIALLVILIIALVVIIFVVRSRRGDFDEE